MGSECLIRMLRIKYILLTFGLLLASCNRAEIISDDVYGVAGDAVDAIPVEAILAEPDNYAGNRMAIRGTIHEVCQMDGCWFMLRSMETEAGLRVHTEMKESGDYTFTVPKDISGRHAVVFGAVTLPEENTEMHYQEDAPGTTAPMLSMTAVGVRVSPEETR